MIYLLVAGLTGGALGAWLGWPHGLLASVVAAPVGASLLTFLVAVIHRAFQIAFSERNRLKPESGDPLSRAEARKRLH